MAEKVSEASFMSYLKIFFRRKEYIIIPAFIGLILGICAGVVLPKKFKSSTILLVEEGKSDNPLFNNLAVSTTVQQRMANIRESILGWNNLVSLVKRLSMDKDVKTVESFEKLILGIRKNIIFTMRGNNVIELAYIDRDPVQTQAVVKNLTDIFIERNVDMQNSETRDAITFIEEQLKVYEGKILSAEIASLEDQLNALLVDSTEKHPTVKSLRERIASKKEDLKKKNLEYTRTESMRTDANNPIITEIKKALDDLEGGNAAPSSLTSASSDLAKVMLINKLDSEMKKDQVLARDAGVNNQVYNMLLQRLETAKITQRLQSSKEGTKYTIIDPPRIPLKPFEPNKPLVIFIGLFLGASIGAALVFILEFFDKSFIDVEEAKEYLGVPLFGAISKITTQDSIRQGQEREAWLYGLTFVAGVVVVIITVAVSALLR